MKRKCDGGTKLPEHDQFLPMWHIDVVFESSSVSDLHSPHEPPFLADTLAKNHIISYASSKELTG
jgi:hypothetical protein